MKKFAFSLERVLSYKRQVEDGLRGEHARAVRSVRQKEDEIGSLETCFGEHREGFNEMLSDGASIVRIREYERYLSGLSMRIAAEKLSLEKLKEKEEQKRREVIEAKKETSSLQMLRDKKKQEYDALLVKQQEQEIEEFVSNQSAASGDKAHRYG